MRDIAMKVIKPELFNSVEFVDCGFFNRTGGESLEDFSSLNVGFDCGDDEQIVIKNRARIAEYFGVDISSLIILHQNHGNVVRVVDETNIDSYKFHDANQAQAIEGDALITKQPGVLIGVMTADCAPILLVDSVEKYVCALHAGWRGALGGIVENAVEKMRELGCGHIYAAIGPCLQARSFEVGVEIAEAVGEKNIYMKRGRYFFDMSGYIMEKLLLLKVCSVSKMNIDTFSNNEFFSYRRQCKNFGRQFSGIVIKK